MVDRNCVTSVATRTTEPLAPLMRPVGVEFSQEDVSPSGTHEITAAERNVEQEVSGHDDAGPVRCNRITVVTLRRSEATAPDVIAGAVVLREENIFLAGTQKIAATKVCIATE